jgi:hypothetical protein
LVGNQKYLLLQNRCQQIDIFSAKKHMDISSKELFQDFQTRT